MTQSMSLKLICSCIVAAVFCDWSSKLRYFKVPTGA